MHHYSVFGLTIASELPLPELPPSTGHVDVVIRRGSLLGPAAGESRSGPTVDQRHDGVLLSWPEVGRVLVQRGCEVVVDAVPDCGAALVRHILLGVSMGVLLHQRGIFTLHASASLIHGTVSAFIGVKGAGKSTLAAALHGAGHPLISDDLVALGVAFDSRRVAVDPGVPQLKLWPDAVEAAMAHSPEDLPRLYAPSPKRLLPMQHRPAGERLDLGSVFVLEWHSDDASEPGVERASSEGAFLALTQHAYPLRFLGKDAVTANHLRQCTHIASHVPVYLLRRPRGLDRLPDVVDCVGWATAGST